jgi:hypothetical protein
MSATPALSADGSDEGPGADLMELFSAGVPSHKFTGNMNFFGT